MKAFRKNLAGVAKLYFPDEVVTENRPGQVVGFSLDDIFMFERAALLRHLTRRGVLSNRVPRLRSCDSRSDRPSPCIAPGADTRSEVA